MRAHEAHHIKRLGMTKTPSILLGISFYKPRDYKSTLSPRHENTVLVPCGASPTSWGKGTSLAFVGCPSSDGVRIKIPYRVDVLLHQPALHPTFLLGWLKLNLTLLLDQLGLAQGDEC